MPVARRTLGLAAEYNWLFGTLGQWLWLTTSPTEVTLDGCTRFNRASYLIARGSECLIAPHSIYPSLTAMIQGHAQGDGAHPPHGEIPGDKNHRFLQLVAGTCAHELSLPKLVYRSTLGSVNTRSCSFVLRLSRIIALSKRVLCCARSSRSRLQPSCVRLGIEFAQPRTATEFDG